MDSRFGYRIIRTTPELDAFGPAWSALWREDPRATPFQSPEWLLPWWRQFQQPELRAVVMMDEGRPAGFLPFYIYREPGTGERQLLLLGAGTTDYLDGVFSAACGIEGVRMALDLLVAEGGWSSLHTSQMRPDSVLLRTLACAHDLAVERFESESCLRMPARRISELPAKIRRNATYYRTRAIRMGKLELSTADESECKGSFETLRRLHTERWALRGEAGVLADE
ncbi:MAG TPA: hypothetical protein VHC72_12245, partial [Bryobacteraceae bacterium]|nr:hypothetical protein [Bryobacteraceae bacterium]